MSSPRSLETLARALDFASDHAVRDMIVDQPHCLHESIHRGGSHEFPAQLFQILRQGKRLRRGRGSLRLRKLLHVRFVTPDEGCQRAFPFDELPGLSGIIDDCLDLAAVSNDPFVFEQTIEVALGEACDPVKVEIVEGGAEILALGEDGAPTQSGLKTFETQFLEQAIIIADRKTPFSVVIGQKLRGRSAPAATSFAVGTDNRRAHLIYYRFNAGFLQARRLNISAQQAEKAFDVPS